MAEKKKCPKCKGDGKVYFGGPLGMNATCDRCNGSGEVDK